MRLIGSVCLSLSTAALTVALKTPLARSLSMSKAFTPWIGSSPSSIARVHMFPMFQDNYGYLIVEPGSNRAACVDPGDGEAVLEACRQLDLELTAAWCTHKHSDHVGGTGDLKSALPHIDIVATRYETVPFATRAVGDGDVFRFDDLTIRTIYAPCHTKGHVLYFVDKDGRDSSQQPILFSGDTLFVGGCGRFFEGTAAEMLSNMNTIATLPANTQVFCGHEYTESNYRFLNSVDPVTCGARYAEAKALRAAGRSTVPSTIADEMQSNLFMKCNEPAVQALVGAGSAEEAMRLLRESKNSFS